MRSEQNPVSLYSGLSMWIFLPASPACSSLSRLGEHFWLMAAGASEGWENILPPSTSLQVPWALSCSGCCCCLLGEERRDRAGVSASWYSCTRALCSSQAWQIFPRWRVGPWGCWPSAALLPKNAWKLFRAAALLLSIELHQTPCFPPLSLKMDADDSPSDMCVICASLALPSSQAAGRLFLVLERPRSGFCWASPCPVQLLHPLGLWEARRSGFPR